MSWLAIGTAANTEATTREAPLFRMQPTHGAHRHGRLELRLPTVPRLRHGVHSDGAGEPAVPGVRPRIRDGAQRANPG